MKRRSALNPLILIIAGFFLSFTLWQCKKTGVVAKDLDRTVVTDSTVFGSFYDKNVIKPSDLVSNINDTIKTRGVQTILKEYCATSNCHGGPIKPRLAFYTDITPYILPGNPEASKLWEYITTNDFDKAMPPVNSNYEVPGQDKVAIYNWIKNGAKEKPALEDFRAPAVKILTQGCGSANNCHNLANAAGGWARKGLIPGLTSADTTQFTYTNPTNGAVTVYCQVSNKVLLNQIWTSYKDSVKRFYADTLGNGSFRPYKTVSTPVSAVSTRGPLNSYDDFIMDIMYPKSIRSSSSVVYTDPVTGNKFYIRGNYLNSSDCFIRRIDSTIIYTNPVTLVPASASGNMAWDDGGLNPSEIALIKAWYFADPNIPDVWKYGPNNAGIFKYKATGNIIRR